MSLGAEAEYIEVYGPFLIEFCDGFHRAYCTVCGQKGSAPHRGDLDTWVNVHPEFCAPDPEYSD